MAAIGEPLAQGSRRIQLLEHRAAEQGDQPCEKGIEFTADVGNVRVA